MNEQEKMEKVGTFKSAAEGLVQLFEMHADGLRQMAEVLEQRRVVADARAKDLDAREAVIKDQEAKIGTRLKAAQDLAVSRLLEKTTAQDSAKRAEEAKSKAVTEMKMAKEEKKRLEDCLAVLLKEKNELAAQLAQAQACSCTGETTPAEQKPVEVPV